MLCGDVVNWTAWDAILHTSVVATFTLSDCFLSIVSNQSALSDLWHQQAVFSTQLSLTGYFLFVGSSLCKTLEMILNPSRSACFFEMLRPARLATSHKSPFFKTPELSLKFVNSSLEYCVTAVELIVTVGVVWTRGLNPSNKTEPQFAVQQVLI